ncbi:HAD-IA family hydrolase [Actinopolymorpha sp. B17G11]|uniref:HAD family hydrolase n=1 Tax=Actinopolymorpha sp. B17G11 TaxID=3160861 RepID=UPI0032E3E92A
MNARRVHGAAVVFDLYETLVTEVDLVVGGTASGRVPADRLGIDRGLFDSLWRARKHERMTRLLAFEDVLAEACVRSGCRPDAEVRARIEELAAERTAAKTSVLRRVDPAVLHTLDQLARAGFRLGLVSNCSVEEVEGWPSSPLARRIDSVVFSYDVGVAKPDPAIYLVACKRLGVPAEACVFVGDGGSDELAGAAAVGMRAFAARWHVNRWPTEVRRQAVARTQGFPALTAPADLLAVLAG